MSATLDIVALALSATNVLAISSASVNASLTFILIPRFLELPPPLNVRLWHSMFEVTKWWVAGPMVISGLGYLTLTYKLRSNPTVSTLLFACGTLCISIVPYTSTIVLPTIRKLWAKVEAFENVPDLESVEEVGEKAHTLIEAWGTWNMGRAFPVMIAGLIGIYAARVL